MALTLNGSTGISGISGSAGTPALQGNNDANTGYFFATDTLGLSTAGTERLKVTSAGLISIGDNNNLDSQLTVTQAQGDCIRLRTNASNNTYKYGIIKLEPYNNNALGVQIVGAKSDSGYTEVDLGGGIDGGYAATQLDFWTAANTTTATGSRRMRIASDGDLHIGGTARPDPTTSGFTVEDNGKYVRWSNGGGTSGTSSSSLTIYGGGSSTNVLATTSWGGAIYLYNTNNTDGNSNVLSFGNSNQLATSFIIGENTSHSSRNGELAFATSSGSAPAERLRIGSDGTVTVQSEDLVFGTTGKGIEFPNSVSIKQNVSNLYVNLASGNNNVEVQSDGTSFVKFRGTNGNVELVNGNLVLSTAGKGIDFSATSDGPSQGNETLDDYERGTYTPQGLSWNGSSWVNVTFDAISRYGRYTKIGGYVHVQGYFSNFHVDSSFDNTLAGISLPFTPINATGMYSVGVTTHSTAFSTAGYTTFFVNSTGSSHMYSMQENTTSYNTWSGSSGRYLMFQASYMCE